MDPFRRNHSSNSKSNLNGSELQRRKDFSKKIAETDENELPFLHNGAPTKTQDLKIESKKNALFSNTSSSFKKKILAERKEDLLLDSSLSPHLEITPQSKYMPCANPSGASFHISPISLHSYDPITNYTSPRPKFLRYDPNQRRELLQRIEGEKRGNEEVWSASSFSSPNSSSKRGNDSDHEEEEELEEEKPLYSCVVWSLLLIFGVLLFISYCMSSSSYPSFEGYESSVDNIQKIQDKAPLRLVGKSLFPENLLGSLMSLSQMCPIVGESFCNLDENLVVSLEIDTIIGREYLGEVESLIEGIRTELSDKTEVVVAEVHDLLLKKGGLVDDDSVVKEKMEHGNQNQRDSGPLAEEGNTNKSASIVETLKENNITSSSVESLLVSLAQDVYDSSFTIREDKFRNESLDSTKFSLISQSRVDEIAPPDDQGLENFNFSLASDTELKSDYSSNILSEVVLRTVSIFLGSLIIVVGLLSRFHKYFPRLNFTSESSLKTETGEKIVTIIPMKEETLDKELDISVESKSSRLDSVPSISDHMNAEFKKVSGFGPPTVELLEEFSPIDAGVTNNGFGSNLKKMEYPNSQFSYHQKGRARKMLSPLPDMLDSAPTEESTSSKFSSKAMLLKKKEVPADKDEISDTSTTSSLRRSSRLRNRVICP